MVEKLNKWKPDTLVVYASIGRILADEQLGGPMPGLSMVFAERRPINHFENMVPLIKGHFNATVS